MDPRKLPKTIGVDLGNKYYIDSNGKMVEDFSKNSRDLLVLEIEKLKLATYDLMQAMMRIEANQQKLLFKKETK